MKVNKKIMVAVFTLIAVLIIVVISLASVLAALSASTGGQFTIKYTAKNVKATISGKYFINTVDSSSGTDLSANGQNSVVFNGTEQGDNAEKTFDSVSDIEIDEDDVFYIKYTITNTSNTLSNPYDIYLTAKTSILESENLNVEYTYVYKYDTRISTTLGTYAYDQYFYQWSTQIEWNSFYKDSLTEPITIAPHTGDPTELNFWIRVSIKDPSQNTEITGGFEFELTSLRT